MQELSTEAKQMLHMILRRLTYTEIRMHILDGKKYLVVCDELDALQRQLEKDILEVGKEGKSD